MKLTIGIKALNEEQHIAASLASAVEAARYWGGDVILADSGSTDRTIEVAKRFPVRIVRLAKAEDASCGAGAQLAFQHARGDYFYLLDGDMVLNAGFVIAAIAYLESEPEVAGVGGAIREMNVDNHDFQIRAAGAAKERHLQLGKVDRLNCGGLYRTAAVRDAGYFADRNLHAFEEFDLGARLQSRGWKLARIDVHAIDHFGHKMGGYHLLWRRIRSGYSGAPGEVLRGAIGQAHLGLVLLGLGHVRNGVAVIIWWCLLAASLILPIAVSLRAAAVTVIFLAPLAWLFVRRGSLELGVYSFVSWNANALGLISGLCRKRVSPTTQLDSVEVHMPDHEESVSPQDCVSA